MTKKLLMGNEAMAHAALEAGVRVVAGYPGTPSSEIVETVARLRAAGSAHGVHVEWSTNEKAALEVLFGASLAGARGLFTCKQMGLNVASDALMSLNYVSVRGGLVLVVADDPGPISSQTEQDTRRFAAFAKVPVLDPATPEQAFDMVKAAFDLSERFCTPVIVRPTTRVDHASAFFDVQDETHVRPVPDAGFVRDPSKWVIFPRRAYEAHGEINERLPLIAKAFSSEPDFAPFNEVTGSDEAAFGIVAGGISAAYAREALQMVEKRVANAGLAMPPYRFMQVGTAYPFPEGAVAAFASGLSDVLVLEELDSVLEDALALWAGRNRVALSVHGKVTGDARDRGENDVDDIASRIEHFLGLSGRLRLRRREAASGQLSATPEVDRESLPVRPPVLCPGCPHRGAFYAVKQALRGMPAVMCGDIGCYTLGNAKPLEAVDTCLCMGAGITMAQGLSIVDPGKKAIAFVGDSTFFASGMTGLANAAYNGHDITVMVLDNATTAMTGSQPHPGTGVTLMGTRNAPLSIESVLVANGFARVYHANPLDKDASIVAVKAALSHDGPTAVVFESPCIQLVDPASPVYVNPDVCTGCKKCITEIGCPAIGFDPQLTGIRSGDRGQAVVDAALCNGCGLCTQVCPFKAISATPAAQTAMLPHLPVEPLSAEELPQHPSDPEWLDDLQKPVMLSDLETCPLPVVPVAPEQAAEPEGSSRLAEDVEPEEPADLAASVEPEEAQEIEAPVTPEQEPEIAEPIEGWEPADDLTAFEVQESPAEQEAFEEQEPSDEAPSGDQASTGGQSPEEGPTEAELPGALESLSSAKTVAMRPLSADETVPIAPIPATATSQEAEDDSCAAPDQDEDAYDAEGATNAAQITTGLFSSIRSSWNSWSAGNWSNVPNELPKEDDDA